MLLKDGITNDMTALGAQGYMFLGYNLKYGHKGYGTLSGVNENQIMEMPVDENLMAGVACGLAMVGHKVCLVFERHDFLCHAMDQIVNHIDKMRDMSNGEFKLKLIIRAIVGSKEPLNPGEQHTGDYTKALESLVRMPIYVNGVFNNVRYGDLSTPCVVVERRVDYGNSY